MRVTVFSLVFVLSVLFFWLAINQYLLPSNAQLGSDLQIVPHSTTLECNPKGECYMHVLASTDVQNLVAGVTGQVRYSDFLEPVRLDKKGVCAQSSLGLTENLQFSDDKANKILTFSVGSLNSDAGLKGGNGCVTTIVFKPVGLTSDPQEARLVLTQPANWKAGGVLQGQRGAFQIKLDETQVSVKIASSVVWPPADDISPTAIPTGTQSCDLAKGDCNCDGAIDVVDWEILRSYTRSEGGTCDIVQDGKGDIYDIAAWVKNNSLILGGIGTGILK